MAIDNKTITTNKIADKFSSLTKMIYELLVRYNKDYKTKNSWVDYYSAILKIKFPIITFNEPDDLFFEKIIKILDLMDMSHLYCKLVNKSLYNISTHESVIGTRK